MTTATSTTETDQPTANVTPIAKPRASRATRAAAQASKPKSTPKSTPKPKPAPKSTGPSAKQAVAAAMIKLVADGLSASPPEGVSKKDALAIAGSLCSYFPGARQGRTPWDKRLGPVSMAGSAAKSSK